MSVQWYPGHMHKAQREMREALSATDALIEVRDARLPASSANPLVDTLAGTGDDALPRLILLSRDDLADPALTATWLDDLAQRPRTTALAIDLHAPDATRRLPERLDAVAGPRAANRLGARTAMVVGIPNVGKSTLINRLAGRTIAVTGNEPAVTKRQQHIKLPGNLGDRWRLRDTPGVLWPNLDNARGGFRLAASGAVRDTATDSAEIACALLDELFGRYDASLRARFGDDLPLGEAVETLEAIGQRRGCLGGGRLVDFDRAARLLLDEFRRGRLGRITLETPTMRDAEAAETAKRVAAQADAREAKAKARRERRKKSRANRR